ncbi:fluoride efflux transporter CrcB [Noviherbaspirillum cavernae]|uniref:Fluoride-specific ion channel FluC n=1 Tax=Noviherbaspirillum cavernae TaxID=2320862 RepID=A0A418X1J8_9BURK|nr:fluoride efflux transporter CrcB [Noviherbaspirillum cavernae]RJG06311.1 fluoride efflux transporter CrcB [Noviherbaspirillum cavernae]
MSWLAVGTGAAIGAWLRWGLGLWFNALHHGIAFGTLAANWVGGFLIGIAVAFFSGNPHLTPEWRLFAVTGFLGGLTTFSTFSAEAMSLLQRGDYAWALGHSALHLLGSIAFCIAGFAVYRAISG